MPTPEIIATSNAVYDVNPRAWGDVLFDAETNVAVPSGPAFPIADYVATLVAARELGVDFVEYNGRRYYADHTYNA